MSTLSTLLKATVLACTTAVAATAVTAEEVTVYVYEKGYFPNIAYMGDATEVKFINKTSQKLGLDYSSGGIMVNSVDAWQSVTVSKNVLLNNPLKEPYRFNINGYSSGRGFAISSAVAPNF